MTACPAKNFTVDCKCVKVTSLGEEAVNLQKNHQESTDQIAAKQAEIVGLWEGVKHKVCMCVCVFYAFK